MQAAHVDGLDVGLAQTATSVAEAADRVEVSGIAVAAVAAVLVMAVVMVAVAAG